MAPNHGLWAAGGSTLLPVLSPVSLGPITLATSRALGRGQGPISDSRVCCICGFSVYVMRLCSTNCVGWRKFKIELSRRR